MAYIVVGILVWVAAGFAIALIFGRMVKFADSQQQLEHRATQPLFVNTLTRH